MSIFKKYLKYIFASVMGMLGFSLYILVDTYFISNKVGADGLTALNLALPAYNVFMGFVMLISIGGATRYTILKSASPEQKNNSVRIASIMGLSLSIIFVIVGIFFSDNLAGFLGATGDIMPLTSIYIKVLYCFAPMFTVQNIVVALTRNDGAPRRAMLAMVAASVSNIIMDYVLIYIFDLGIFGAALATGIAPVMGFAISFFRKKGFGIKAVLTRADWHREIKGIFNTGFSSLIGEWASMVVMFTFNMLILKSTGNVGVAAYGIIANIAYVMTAIFTGVAQGSQPLVSEYYAVSDTASQRKILKYGIFTTAGVALVGYALLSIFAGPVIDIFNSENNTRLAELANDGIKIYFAGYIFGGANIFMVSFMAASEQVTKSAIISLCRGVFALVAFALLLSYLWGMNGIWISMGVAEIFTSAVILIWTFFEKRKKIGHQTDS